MKIREARPEDAEAIATLYGAHVPMDEVFRGRVVIDNEDRPRIYIGARKTTESYMAVDPKWETPAWRLEAIRELIADMHRVLVTEGFTDTYIFEDEQDKAWVRRLWKMGCRKMLGKICFRVMRGDF